MRPAAIALNYNVKDIRNDVRQKIAIEHTSVGLTHACPNYGTLLTSSKASSGIQPDNWNGLPTTCSIPVAQLTVCN